jgi:hypothetical protein
MGADSEIIWPGQRVYDVEGKPRDHKQLSSMTSATGLPNDKINHPTYGPAVSITFSVETAAVRCSWHGVDPTVAGATQVGHPLNAGDSYTVRGIEAVQQFKCINNVAGNAAVVMVTFYYVK